MKNMPMSLLNVRRLAKQSLYSDMSYCQRLDFIVSAFGYPSFGVYKLCSERPLNCCRYCKDKS